MKHQFFQAAAPTNSRNEGRGRGGEVSFGEQAGQGVRG